MLDADYDVMTDLAVGAFCKYLQQAANFHALRAHSGSQVALNTQLPQSMYSVSHITV